MVASDRPSLEPVPDTRTQGNEHISKGVDSVDNCCLDTMLQGLHAARTLRHCRPDHV